ncbi:MAG: N-acetylmuramoyl-L-alanine amidase [Sporomusaceae bacterium]|nr:N-acetylmuramoyl-L-alanine amidase [Sporomusaceae bacterium]
MNEQNPLSGKMIVIDPGHGGSDEGVVSPSGCTEKAVTMQLACRLHDRLKQQGAVVLLTHYDDQCVCANASSISDELFARTAIANKHIARAFISIHLNGFYDTSVGGTATLYKSDDEASEKLAACVHQEITRTCTLLDRGYEPSDLYLLQQSNVPAIQIEPAFLSNLSEEKFLQNPLFQERLIRAICKGLEKFFSLSPL